MMERELRVFWIILLVLSILIGVVGAVRDQVDLLTVGFIFSGMLVGFLCVDFYIETGDSE